MTIHWLELWPALMLGAVGSLHCAGMCGPLMLALPPAGHTRSTYLLGRAVYHGGRLLTYSLLGCVIGLVGATLSMAGIQRWVSLGAGVAILVGVLFYRRAFAPSRAFKGVAWLKASLSALIKRRTLPSQFLFGGLNGLLPCGLVYVACSAALTTGSVLGAWAFMLAFGLGTFPMMIALSLPGGAIQARLAPRFRQLIPACLVVMALLLILRGLSLGIPYLSPDLAVKTSCCPPGAH